MWFAPVYVTILHMIVTRSRSTAGTVCMLIIHIVKSILMYTSEKKLMIFISVAEGKDILYYKSRNIGGNK